MQWIGDWIKQVVLLVLLATFVDLLLPNQSLSRYVKLVMGLLIILAIISPVLNLLTDDLKLDQISWKQLSLHQEKKMPSLAEIQNKGQEIKKMGQEQIIESWKEQVSHTIEVDLQNKFSLIVSSLELKARMKGRNPQITEAKLIAVQTAYPKQQTKPIQPVDFTNPLPVTKRDMKLQQKVKQYLADTWKIDHARIEIRGRK